MIYNAPSIYKQGGGGGGYEDGGALVDADIIEVKNNTVSTYENTSRNEVDFYIVKEPGTILNSVIEFTTQVNATVNVYYLNENNVLVLLGVVGSNSVSAGDTYNINITGNGYEIEQITPPPAPDPDEYMTILYGCKTAFKRFGGWWWQKYDNVGIIPGVRYIARNGTVYYNAADIYAKNNTFDNGYMLPTLEHPGWLASALGKSTNDVGEVLKDTTGWDVSTYPGDNSADLNFKGVGCIVNNNQDWGLGGLGLWAFRSERGSVQAYTLAAGNYKIGSLYMASRDTTYFALRFIKSAL